MDMESGASRDPAHQLAYHSIPGVECYMEDMSDSDDEHLDMDTAALEDIVQEPASPPAAAVPAMHHLAQGMAEEAASSVNDIAALVAEVRDLKESLAHARRARLTLSKALDEQRAASVPQEGRLAHQQVAQELQDSKRRCAQLRQQVQQQASTIHELNDNVADLEESVEHEKATVRELINENDRCEEQLQLAQSTLSDREESMVFLQHQNFSLANAMSADQAASAEAVLELHTTIDNLKSACDAAKEAARDDVAAVRLEFAGAKAAWDAEKRRFQIASAAAVNEQTGLQRQLDQRPSQHILDVATHQRQSATDNAARLQQQVDAQAAELKAAQEICVSSLADARAAEMNDSNSREMLAQVQQSLVAKVAQLQTAQHRMGQLEHKVTELQAREAHMTASHGQEKHTLQQAISSRDAQLLAAQQQAVAAQHQITHLHAAHTAVAAELQTAEASKAAAEGQFSDLKRELAARHATCADMQAGFNNQVASLHEAASLKDVRIVALERQLSEVQQQHLQAQAAASAALTQQKIGHQTQLAELHQAVSDKDAQVEAAQRETTALQQRITELHASQTAALAQTAADTSNIAHLEQAIASGVVQAQTASSQVAALEQQITRLQTLKSQGVAQTVGLQQALVERDTQLAVAQSNTASLQQQLAQAYATRQTDSAEVACQTVQSAFKDVPNCELFPGLQDFLSSEPAAITVPATAHPEQVMYVKAALPVSDKAAALLQAITDKACQARAALQAEMDKTRLDMTTFAARHDQRQNPAGTQQVDHSLSTAMPAMQTIPAAASNNKADAQLMRETQNLSLLQDRLTFVSLEHKLCQAALVEMGKIKAALVTVTEKAADAAVSQHGVQRASTSTAALMSLSGRSGFQPSAVQHSTAAVHADHAQPGNCSNSLPRSSQGSPATGTQAGQARISRQAFPAGPSEPPADPSDPPAGPASAPVVPADATGPPAAAPGLPTAHSRLLFESADQDTTQRSSEVAGVNSQHSVDTTDISSGPSTESGGLRHASSSGPSRLFSSLPSSRPSSGLDDGSSSGPNGNDSWYGSDLWDTLWDDSMQEERNRATRIRRMNRGRPAGPAPPVANCETHSQAERQELTYVENGDNQAAMAVNLRVRVPGATAAAPDMVNKVMSNDQTRPICVRQNRSADANVAANSGAESLDDSREAEAQEVSRQEADSIAMQRGQQAEQQARGAEQGGRAGGKAKRGRPTAAEDSANAGALPSKKARQRYDANGPVSCRTRSNSRSGSPQDY